MTQTAEVMVGQGGTELPSEEKERRHAEYVKMFRGSLSAAALALSAIKREETYVVDGYINFRDFVQDELGLGVTGAEILAAEGRLFALLEDKPEYADVLGAITKVEQLRPIYKMDAERQVRVLQLACEKAPKTRAGRPSLSGELVAEVAERHYNWTRNKAKKKTEDPNQKPEGLRLLEKSCQTIAECGLTPEEAVELFGATHTWDFFEPALEFMRLAKRASPKKK